MAWRWEPYYSRFKQWSARFAGQKLLIVFVKKRVTVVLPDKDVELGEVGSIDDIRIFSEMTPQGPSWNAVKTPTKVPSDSHLAR
jgi:hypothetical protein